MTIPEFKSTLDIQLKPSIFFKWALIAAHCLVIWLILTSNLAVAIVLFGLFLIGCSAWHCHNKYALHTRISRLIVGEQGLKLVLGEQGLRGAINAPIFCSRWVCILPLKLLSAEQNEAVSGLKRNGFDLLIFCDSTSADEFRLLRVRLKTLRC